MYIEQSIKPVSTMFLQSDSIQFNDYKEKFRDIFQWTLNNKSNSRPPKIELTGILKPLPKSGHQPHYNFKLETDQNEYFLRMGGVMVVNAKKLEWEEVTVKGYLDPDEGVFEVEKISLSKRSLTNRLSLGPTDLYSELDLYKRSIARKGVIDIAPEYVAS